MKGGTIHQKKLLLHVCCGPCSTHSIELLKRDYLPTIFWSNSNIFPLEEYRKRLQSGETVASANELNFVQDSYDHEAWSQAIAGEEDEPERGARCAKCFAFSFGRAAKFAIANGFECFTTTLTISPHKDTNTIFEVGRRIGEIHNVSFLEIDLKENGGFARSVELAKSLNLYRQNYCGCEFSMRA